MSEKIIHDLKELVNKYPVPKGYKIGFGKFKGQDASEVSKEYIDWAKQALVKSSKKTDGEIVGKMGYCSKCSTYAFIHTDGVCLQCKL
jgi:hypothetical protein